MAPNKLFAIAHCNAYTQKQTDTILTGDYATKSALSSAQTSLTNVDNAIKSDVSSLQIEMLTKADIGDVNSLNTTVTSLSNNLTSLQNKLNTEVANLQSSISNAVSAAGIHGVMPKWSAGVALASGFVCPSDGWIVAAIHCDYGKTVYVKVNNEIAMGCVWTRTADYSGYRWWSFVPVAKGNTVTFTNQTSYVFSSKFYPCLGA